jgi:hypothetical protein
MTEESSPEARVHRGIQLALARDETARERELLLRLLEKTRAHFAANPADAEAYLKQGDSPRSSRLPAPELAAWTSIASLILNLDESVTRE